MSTYRYGHGLIRACIGAGGDAQPGDTIHFVHPGPTISFSGRLEGENTLILAPEIIGRGLRIGRLEGDGVVQSVSGGSVVVNVTNPVSAVFWKYEAQMDRWTSESGFLAQKDTALLRGISVQINASDITSVTPKAQPVTPPAGGGTTTPAQGGTTTPAATPTTMQPATQPATKPAAAATDTINIFGHSVPKTALVTGGVILGGLAILKLLFSHKD